MRRHRIAIIGLGMAVTPHAKSLVDLKDRVEVVSAMSRSEARRRAFAASFRFETTDTIGRIADDRSIEAVAILTPPNTHLEIVTQLARAGKHILLEKPLDITTLRAEKLVAHCAGAGVKLAVVLQHRFKPAAERLTQIIAAGELGTLVGASARIPLWRPQSYYDEPGRGTKARDGGGVLLTQGIHTLDLFLSLCGPIDEVCGFTATSPVHRMETEDLVCVAVRTVNGALGVIEATTAAYPGAGERIDLIGTRGTAALYANALDVFFHDGRRVEHRDELAATTGAGPMDFPHHFHLGVWRDFLDAIENDRPPRVSGEEALKVHRLIDALLSAGAAGEHVRAERP